MGTFEEAVANNVAGITKGTSAANYYFWLTRLQPAIVETPENAQHGPARDIQEIEFDRAKFTYPLRPGHQVLRGIDIKIERGQFVAFVGASGCGKSTMIACE